MQRWYGFLKAVSYLVLALMAAAIAYAYTMSILYWTGISV
jgi:uncharacterized membrane protein